MLTKRKNFNINLKKMEEIERKFSMLSRQAILDGYEYVSNGGRVLTDVELSERYKTLFEIDAFKSGYFSNYKGDIVQGIRKIQKMQLESAVHYRKPVEDIEETSIFQHRQTETASHDSLQIVEKKKEASPSFNFFDENIMMKRINEIDLVHTCLVNCAIDFDLDEFNQRDLHTLNKEAFTSFDDIFMENEPKNKKRP